MVSFRIIKDEYWDEYQVQCIDNGVVIPERTYHTDSKDDAKQTAAAMMSEEVNRV